MFNRARSDFSTMATLLPAAESAARAEGLATASAEHLVLAALELPDGTAARALGRVGVAADRVRGAIDEAYRAALAGTGAVGDPTRADAVLEAALPEPVPARGPLRTDPSAQALFKRVRALAKQDGAPIAGAHVVLAACELRHGVLARVFDLLGVDREALVAAARDELADQAR